MVDILRQKPVNEPVRDVSSGLKAVAGGMDKFGRTLENFGDNMQKEEATALANREKEIQQDAKMEAARVAQAQKAASASDKIHAADMASQMENDLLRWNEEQRMKNPNNIGGKDYENMLRDQVDRLSEKYGKNFGTPEAQQEFLKSSQSMVNQMTESNIKWDYAKRIKQGEQAAKRIADGSAATARFHGANGDVEGFKESQAAQRDKLKDYIKTVNPKAAPAALYESDKKNLKEWFIGLAQTDPQAARDILLSAENFNKVVPDDMVGNVQGIYRGAQEKQLNDELIKVNAAIETLPDKSPASKEYKKKKKKIEKDLAEIPEYREESVAQIRKEIESDVHPIIEKSLGENALMAKVEENFQKVETFIDFTKVPTESTINKLESMVRGTMAEEKKNQKPVSVEEINKIGMAEDDFDILVKKMQDGTITVEEINAAGAAEDDFHLLATRFIAETKPTEAKAKALADRTNQILEENSFLSPEAAKNQAMQDLEDNDYIAANPQSKTAKGIDTIREMKKYRRNFGKVSFEEVSSFQGTQKNVR